MGEIRNALLDDIDAPSPEELERGAIKRRVTEKYWRLRQEGRTEAAALALTLDDAVNSSALMTRN